MRKKEESTKFVKALLPSVLALCLIWGVFLTEHILGVSFARFGLFPRTFSGLRGILLSPFIHGDITHIANNSLPLAVLLFYLFSLYRELSWKILLWSTLMTGLWVWVAARPSYHIGASGIIYALTFFLFASGLIRRHTQLMAVSMSVAFFYGSLIWGIFPLIEEYSWESHLFGGLSGVVLALYYRKVGLQRVKPLWEQMSEEEYLRENITRFGEFYWDPVKQAEMRKAEEQQDVSYPGWSVVYHYVETKKTDEKPEDFGRGALPLVD